MGFIGFLHYSQTVFLGTQGCSQFSNHQDGRHPYLPTAVAEAHARAQRGFDARGDVPVWPGLEPLLQPTGSFIWLSNSVLFTSSGQPCVSLIVVVVVVWMYVD